MALGAKCAGWTSTIYARAGRQHRVAANGTIEVTEEDFKPPLAAGWMSCKHRNDAEGGDDEQAQSGIQLRHTAWEAVNGH
jgi:hypothetical protein